MLRDPELYKEIAIKKFDSFVDHRFIIEPGMDVLMGNTLFLMRGKQVSIEQQQYSMKTCNEGNAPLYYYKCKCILGANCFGTFYHSSCCKSIRIFTLKICI